jgi:hypothetical protein
MQRGGLHFFSRTKRGYRLIAAGLSLGALIASHTGAAAADAASRELTFLRGLRDRGYYDYVAFEVDQAKKRGTLSADLIASLDFEKAITQVDYARSLLSAESQAKELDRAARSLEQFVRAHPDHALVARARREQAQILLDRARVEIWRLNAKDSAEKQETARATARQLITQAQDLFQKAFEQAKTAYERFPRATLDDPKVRVDRMRAQSDYLLAQLNLAICKFEEGITYAPKSSERQSTLAETVAEFEKIHVSNRTLSAGAQALLWEGKCFEEQGNTQKALGIYNQLAQPLADNDAARYIRDQAVQFRLACLNQQSAKDSSLVINEATKWLDKAKDRKQSSTGRDIRWQRALAAEHMASVKDTDPEDRERWRRLAAGDAREVSRFPGEHKTQALALADRLGGEPVRKKGSEIRDFAAGFTVARKNMDDIESLKQEIDAAKGEEKEKLQKQWHEQLVSTAVRLRHVLDAADARTDRRELNQARYFLAFVDYELGNNDDAAILAEYAARRLHAVNPELSREAARLALAAYEQEFEARSQEQRTTMVRIARPVAEFLIRNWPEQDRANEARITMARLSDRAKLYVEAAEWYANVTDGFEQYAEAQIGAGREYWVASQSVPKRAAPAKNAAPATADPQISDLTAKAEKFLKNGIEKAGDAADANGNPPDWLTVGKTELANLDIGMGRYDDAVKLLTDPPHSVVTSVAVNDEATRPTEGVKGRPFASYVFQSLLRAQIGRHQVDASLEAMQQLEKIAGASGAEGVTAIYVSLGKEIEKELARLVATNDRARLGEVRKSFEKFLEELAKRSDKMSYGSLLWIAETYTGLGDGMAEDPGAAREYFAKAAHAYEELLTRAAADNSPTRTDRMLSLQLRLANCLRRQGNFAKSLEVFRGVITQRPKALDVQVAAANMLEDWGASPDAGSELRSLDAIRGLRDQAGGGAVWGWEGIAARLERVLASGKADNELREKYFEARYNIPLCRHQYAQHDKDKASRAKALEVALGEIDAFARVSADLNEDSWQKLDTLYQDIETDLGRKPTPLARPDLRAATPAGAVATAKPTAAAPTNTKTADVEPNRPTQSAPVAKTASAPVSKSIAPGWILLGLVFGVAATIGGVVWNIRRQKPSRASLLSLGAPEFVDLPGQSAPRPKPAAARPQPKPTGSTVTRKPSGAVGEKTASDKTVPQKKAGPKAP